MKTSLATRICSSVPTLFAVWLCALFLSCWYAVRTAGEAMLPDELGGPGAVSFAVALLNSWNDREHAAALRASVPPPLPPGG